MDCLAVVTSPVPALVSGGRDATVRVWHYNAAAGIFMFKVRARTCTHARTNMDYEDASGGVVLTCIACIW